MEETTKSPGKQKKKKEKKKKAIGKKQEQHAEEWSWNCFLYRCSELSLATPRHNTRSQTAPPDKSQKNEALNQKEREGESEKKRPGTFKEKPEEASRQSNKIRGEQKVERSEKQPQGKGGRKTEQR